MKNLSKKANHDGTVRFMSDFVAESGALKSVRAFVISIENKHVFGAKCTRNNPKKNKRMRKNASPEIGPCLCD
jgi:hypothetical protein